MALDKEFGGGRAGGLAVLAFPCNQFGGQESGSHEEIWRFARGKYGARFPLFAKCDVNGDFASPVFQYLKANLPGLLGQSVKWNFAKFLCDAAGKPVKRYGPHVDPKAIRKDILKLLAPGTASAQGPPARAAAAGGGGGGGGGGE